MKMTLVTLLMSHLERSWSNARAPLNTANVWMVGGCEEKEEEEEKTWLDLYVYYTTQYRKDNLLCCISVTREVSHSEI